MSDDVPILTPGTDYGLAIGGKFWREAGLQKLEAAGIWKREFIRGSYGSPNAEVKTKPPSVDAVLAIFAERRAKAAAAKAEQARIDERMRRPSLIPSAAAPAKPKPAATAYTADELAALINRH